MSITIDLNAFKASMDQKRAEVHAAARPAAQAGAQVIYEAARLNAHVGEKVHFFYGTSYKKTGQKYGPFYPGNLRDSIYQVFSEDNSGPTRATYHIGPNLKKAPYGPMVEFGTIRSPSHSFIGKALAEQRQAALQAMRTTFVQKVST